MDVLVQSLAGRLTTGSADFDSGQWTLGRRVYSGEFDGDFAVNNPGFNSLAAGSPALPAGSQTLPGNAALAWDFLPMMIDELKSNLFYWDGVESDGIAGITPNDVRFGPLPSPDYALSLFDRSQAKFSVTGTDETVLGGVIDITAADGSMHRHRFYQLEVGNANGPADGIYLFSIDMRISGLETSKPIYMVFGTLGSSVAALDSAAVPWVTSRVDMLIPEPLLGDYNSDGFVDAADYVVWRETAGEIGAMLPADGDSNGIVDPVDYGVWRANFGRTLSNLVTNSSIPEPETWILFGMAAAAMVVLSSKNRARLWHSGKCWFAGTIRS